MGNKTPRTTLHLYIDGELRKCRAKLPQEPLQKGDIVRQSHAFGRLGEPPRPNVDNEDFRKGLYYEDLGKFE